jgi:hypothetical protein
MIPPTAFPVVTTGVVDLVVAGVDKPATSSE